MLAAMRRYFDTYEHRAVVRRQAVGRQRRGYVEHNFDKRDTRAAVQVGWPQLVSRPSTISRSRAPVPGACITGSVSATRRNNNRPRRRRIRGAPQLHPRRRRSEGSDAAPRWQLQGQFSAQLLVTLEVLNTARRYEAALVDPLPAGFEPVNPRLVTSERVTVETDGWDHINQRDERAEAFSMSLAEGSHRSSATSSGRPRRARKHCSTGQGRGDAPRLRRSGAPVARWIVVVE